MKLLSGTLGVLLLLALLTWLLLRGIDTNAPAYAVILRAFDDFALAEASLHRDVLQARAGLLRNYDPLIKAMEAMEDAVTRLRSYAQTEGLDVGPTDRLAATVAQQEELTERFKSSNALLQNSLSYVGLLSTSPAFGAQDAQLAPATGALAAAILYLRRDTSPDAVKALQERIDRFAAQAPTVGPDAEAARALLAHARLLHDLIPAVDETLKSIIVAPSRQPLEESRALFSSRRSAVEATAQRFRLLLYRGLAAVARHPRESRPSAACPRPCAATASSIRACHSRELDTPDQLPAGGDRRAAEASAGRALPSDRRGTRLCGAG
jgi:hypothetical protein